MSQVKDLLVLVMFRITVQNQDFFEGFFIMGPFFSICIYHATISGQIAGGGGGGMQDTHGYAKYAASNCFSRCISDSNGVSASPAMNLRHITASYLAPIAPADFPASATTLMSPHSPK